MHETRSGQAGNPAGSASADPVSYTHLDVSKRQGLLDRGNEQRPHGCRDHNAGRKTQKYPLEQHAVALAKQKDRGRTQRRHCLLYTSE